MVTPNTQRDTHSKHDTIKYRVNRRHALHSANAWNQAGFLVKRTSIAMESELSCADLAVWEDKVLLDVVGYEPGRQLAYWYVTPGTEGELACQFFRPG